MEINSAEISKKRKDRSTPPEKGTVKDSDFSKKVKQDLLYSSSEDDENRIRTPSGTICEFNSRDIRNFFSASKKNPRSSKADLNCAKPSQGVIQPRNCARADNHAKPTKRDSKCDKSVRRKIVNSGSKKSRVSSKIKVASWNTNCKRHLKTTEEDNGWISDSEDFLTPSASSINSSFEGNVHNISSPNQELLKTIALGMKTITYEDFKAKMSEINECNQNEQAAGDDINAVVVQKEIQSTESVKEATIDMDTETQNDANPKTISLAAVWEMFNSLQGKFNQVINKFDENAEALKTECAEGSAKVVNEIIEQQCLKKFEKVESELAHYKHKTKVLTDVCNSLHVEVSDLTQRIENLEMNCSKRMILVSGLVIVENAKKYENVELIKLFIKEKLGVEVYVDDYFAIGASNPKALVIELQTLAEKKLVMRNKNKLKNVRNEYQQKVYINDYVPLPIQEKRKRDNQIIREYEEAENAEDINISYSAGNLIIQGERYRKMVIPPTPKELIEIPVQELQRILDIKTTQSSKLTKENSIFQAFAASVSTFAEIRNLYVQLKLNHPEARHIACAYIIDGVIHSSRDFHDDGESGAGRILLQILTENKLSNTVVFVTRRYGGTRMGAARFVCYKQVARQALNLPPLEEQKRPPATTQRKQVHEMGEEGESDHNMNASLKRRRGGRSDWRKSARGSYYNSRGGYTSSNMQIKSNSQYLPRYNNPPIRHISASTQYAPSSRYELYFNQDPRASRPYAPANIPSTDMNFSFANPLNPRGMYDQNWPRLPNSNMD